MLVRVAHGDRLASAEIWISPLACLSATWRRAAMIAFADNGYLLMRIKRAAAQLALPMRRLCARVGPAALSE
ncbi:hypothetical protein [Erythrobacter neustonensis]|uniref:hypothetical protein n=1 Tax=Erythrobacter neustonensis TaxID=1112 RepID=UPI0012E89ACC|nr:hypothetical protein [Erythrobacter neustonensis]